MEVAGLANIPGAVVTGSAPRRTGIGEALLLTLMQSAPGIVGGLINRSDAGKKDEIEDQASRGALEQLLADPNIGEQARSAALGAGATLNTPSPESFLLGGFDPNQGALPGQSIQAGAQPEFQRPTIDTSSLAQGVAGQLVPQISQQAEASEIIGASRRGEARADRTLDQADTRIGHEGTRVELDRLAGERSDRLAGLEFDKFDASRDDSDFARTQTAFQNTRALNSEIRADAELGLRRRELALSGQAMNLGALRDFADVEAGFNMSFIQDASRFENQFKLLLEANTTPGITLEAGAIENLRAQAALTVWPDFRGEVPSREQATAPASQRLGEMFQAAGVEGADALLANMPQAIESAWVGDSNSTMRSALQYGMSTNQADQLSASLESFRDPNGGFEEGAAQSVFQEVLGLAGRDREDLDDPAIEATLAQTAHVLMQITGQEVESPELSKEGRTFWLAEILRKAFESGQAAGEQFSDIQPSTAFPGVGGSGGS